MFTEPQGHLVNQVPGFANDCIAVPEGLYPFFHLIRYIYFPHQFIIKIDAKVFNPSFQGQLHSLIFKPTTLLVFLSLVKSTISVFSRFTDSLFDFIPGV